MKIYNVRLGPACNSSSTHSLLLLKPEHVGKLKDSDKGDGSFGWDWFTAVSRRSKLDYLSAALFGALKEDVGVETACAVVRDWLGRDILDRDISDETLSEYYIDHQSQWCMPRGWDGKGVDRQFVEDMKTFLLRDDVAVLGGNDNVSPGVNHPDEGPDFTFDGHKHLDKGDVVNVPLPLDGGPDGGKSLRCRKDPKGFWTIFNKVGGSKIRFSFESLAADVVEKSTHPELVDVKVTDYCEENCPYCYQGSTTKGAHADKNYVNALLVTFGELRVFEVAFGGGEPLLWPGLQSALNVSRYYGVQGNFTTRQTDWLEDPQRRKDILGTGDSMSAVAFSVDNAQAVARIAELVKPVIDTGGWRGDVMRESHFSIQVVVGAMGTDEFEKIAVAAKEAKLPLTLLGFKDTGRGGAFKKKRLTTPDWAGVLKRTGYYSIQRPYPGSCETSLKSPACETPCVDRPPALPNRHLTAWDIAGARKGHRRTDGRQQSGAVHSASMPRWDLGPAGRWCLRDRALDCGPSTFDLRSLHRAGLPSRAEGIQWRPYLMLQPTF